MQFWTWSAARKYVILKIGVRDLSEMQENNRLEGEKRCNLLIFMSETEVLIADIYGIC